MRIDTYKDDKRQAFCIYEDYFEKVYYFSKPQGMVVKT